MLRGAGTPVQLPSLSPAPCGPQGSTHSPGCFHSWDSQGRSQVSLLGRKGKPPRSSVPQRRTWAWSAEHHVWSVPHTWCVLTQGCLSPIAPPHLCHDSPFLTALDFLHLSNRRPISVPTEPLVASSSSASGYPLKM